MKHKSRRVLAVAALVLSLGAASGCQIVNGQLVLTTAEQNNIFCWVFPNAPFCNGHLPL
jgi:hypothetical protein